MPNPSDVKVSRQAAKQVSFTISVATVGPRFVTFAPSFTTGAMLDSLRRDLVRTLRARCEALDSLCDGENNR